MNDREIKVQSNPFGKVTSFVYQIPGGNLTSMKDAMNHQTSYTYNSVKRLRRAQQGSMRTVCSYEDDRLSGLSHGDDNNNTNYTFTYDGFGRCTRVKAGTRNLVTQTWAANVTTAYAYDNGGNMTIRKTNERNTNVF